MEPTKLNDFATKYTAAWCSQNAINVASLFSPAGSLKINKSKSNFDPADYARQLKAGHYKTQVSFQRRGRHNPSLTLDPRFAPERSFPSASRYAA